MISLISTILNAILSFILHILKAFFSMLTWFLKGVLSLLKLFFCFLPATSILFSLLFVADIYLYFAGIPDIEPLSKYNSYLSKDIQISAKLISDMKIWWTLNIYPYRGNITFILLIILSLIMFLPVVFVLLSISVVLSFGQLLFYAAAFDIIIYVLRAIFHKSFLAQFQDRFFAVFPEKGKRHYEKNYEKWLRKHHGQFEDDDLEAVPVRNKVDEFYEDDDNYYEEDYEDDYDDYYEDDYDKDYDDQDAIEDKRYKSRKRFPYRDQYENDEYEDIDEYYEDDENYDDDENGDESESSNDTNRLSSFDFFAGCSSRESADRKYKSLVKLYHPDNMDGDTAAIAEINTQYAQAKKRFS